MDLASVGVGGGTSRASYVSIDTHIPLAQVVRAERAWGLARFLAFATLCTGLFVGLVSATFAAGLAAGRQDQGQHQPTPTPPPTSTSTAQSLGLPRGEQLIGLWELRGDVRDGSGHGYHGTVVGRVSFQTCFWRRGGVETAACSHIAFMDVNHAEDQQQPGFVHVDLPRTSQVQAQGTTLTAWFRTRSTIKPHQVIALLLGTPVGKTARNAPVCPSEEEWCGGLVLNATENTERARMFGVYGGSNHAMPIVNDHFWHFAALVLSPNSGFSVYLDGVEMSSSATPPWTSALQERQFLRIGAAGEVDDDVKAYFDGQIAWVGLWDCALSFHEVGEVLTKQSRYLLSSSRETLRPTTARPSSSPSHSAFESLPQSTKVLGFWTLMLGDLENRVRGKPSAVPHGAMRFTECGDSRLQFADFNGLDRAPGDAAFFEVALPTSKNADVTLAAWFITRNATKPGQIIAYLGSDQHGNGFGVSVNHEGDTNGDSKGTGIMRSLYGGIVWFGGKQQLVATGKWYHVAMVLRRWTGFDLYVNGKHSYSGTGSPRHPTSYLHIGSNDYSSAARHFNGRIANVGVWDVALSSGEVNQLFTTQQKQFTSQC